MESLIAILALAAMEIVLGIDNIVFISILAGHLPVEQRSKARRVGLLLAMGTRIGLLFCLSIILSLTEPVFELTSLGVPESWIRAHTPAERRAEEESADDGANKEKAKEKDKAKEEDKKKGSIKLGHGHGGGHGHNIFEERNGISVKDLILLAGGIFLIWKSVKEIHSKLDGEEEEHVAKKGVTFTSVITQIAILDIVFSLDSVITAVGMVDQVWVMVLAVIIAVIVMMIFSDPIGDFVESNPTLKILALSFLILIGVTLVAESIEAGLNKNLIYFAMGFALLVELLNLRMKARSKARAAKKAEE